MFDRRLLIDNIIKVNPKIVRFTFMLNLILMQLRKLLLQSNHIIGRICNT